LDNFDPLRDYLAHQTKVELVLTFEEIEDILGFCLAARVAAGILVGEGAQS
jgi:hypothetical protein